LVVWPLAVELLFRSLVHGFLAQSARIGRPRSPILFSWPLVGAALLFAAFTLWQAAGGISPADFLETPWRFLRPAAGAFAFGVVLGLARERSQSILPPMLFHMCAAAGVLAAARLVF
jgi:membrane protease YdiL (CAAX protease family)